MRRRADAHWLAVPGVVLFLAVLRVTAFHVSGVERADQLVFAGFAGFHRPRGAYDAATLLSETCGPVAFVCLAVVLAVIAALRAGRAAVGTVLVVLAGANLTTELLKRVLAEPRFSAVPGGRLPSATAWPSGHATAAASLVLACVIVSPVRWRPRVAAVGTAFFLTIAYALMTLRWHYETDVIGGLAVATGWGLLATGLLGRRLPARPGRDAVRGVVAAAAVTWVLLVAVAWPYLLHYAESRSAFLAGTGVLAGCTAVAVGALARVGGRPVLGRDLANTAGRVRAPSRRTQPAEAEQLPS